MDIIPNEILLQICNNLNIPDLLRFSGSSSRVYQIYSGMIVDKKREYYIGRLLGRWGINIEKSELTVSTVISITYHERTLTVSQNMSYLTPKSIINPLFGGIEDGKNFTLKVLDSNTDELIKIYTTLRKYSFTRITFEDTVYGYIYLSELKIIRKTGNIITDIIDCRTSSKSRIVREAIRFGLQFPYTINKKDLCGLIRNKLKEMNKYIHLINVNDNTVTILD